MKTRFVTTISWAALGWLAAAVNAAAQLGAGTYMTTSIPQGSLVLPLAGGSDNYTSLPVQHIAAVSAAVLSANQTNTTATITMQPPTTLTPNQFVYSAGVQSQTFYVQFLSGARAGMFYTVTANGMNTVTVDPNGDTGLAAALGNGTAFTVIPYWTLNTVFFEGAGVYPTTNATLRTVVLTPNVTGAGINLPPAASYYYFTGNGSAIWKKVGDSSNKDYGDLPLAPDLYFIVRQPLKSQNTTLDVEGVVPMSQVATVVGNLKAKTAQDNAVALPVPENVTLGNSGLYPNVIGGSPGLTPTDSLLVYDPAVIRQNKTATAIYFYYTGAQFGGPGWRKQGAPTVICNNQPILVAGQGFIIRRAARPEPNTVTWAYLPSYLQQ
jgi:uncharacterized protein (TIGR02597 family)